MPGQPQKGTNPWIGLDCTNFKVADPADPLGPSNLIIPAGTNFQVAVDFEFDGMLANWLMGTVIPYKVTYYHEGMGAAPEGELGSKSGNTSAGQTLYTGADTRATVSLSDPGTYRLTAVVTFTGPPVTAFVEGPMIQIS